MTERPKTQPKTGIFNAIRRGFQQARDLFAPLFNAQNLDAPTQRDLQLDGDEFAVKRKLGASFFRRRLNHNTRVARIASLTEGEYNIAVNKGWL